LGTLSEPRRKQNLYANPKRTAKLSMISDAPGPEKVQYFSKNFEHFMRLSAPLYINPTVTL
jgi:hypothetical protein